MGAVSSKSLDWKKNKQAQGLCTVCGVQSLVTKWHCRACADALIAAKEVGRLAGKCRRCGKNELPLHSKWECAPCYERSRLQRLAGRYGLAVGQYEAMLAKGCRICGVKQNLVVDHDHLCCATQSKCCGRCVRGVLCTRHNILVGALEHPDVQLARRYLRATQKPKADRMAG